MLIYGSIGTLYFTHHYLLKHIVTFVQLEYYKNATKELVSNNRNILPIILCLAVYWVVPIK